MATVTCYASAVNSNGHHYLLCYVRSARGMCSIELYSFNLLNISSHIQLIYEHINFMLGQLDNIQLDRLVVGLDL